MNTPTAGAASQEQLPRPCYRVAVVGRVAWADEDTLARLIYSLVARVRDTHRIILVTGGPRRSPDLMWCFNWWYGLELVQQLDGIWNQDVELASWADAALVLGDVRPHRGLITRFAVEKKPLRHFTARPNVPPWSRLLSRAGA